MTTSELAKELVIRVAALEQENKDLKSRLATDKRTSGEGFIRGKLTPVGPKRPNRPKLTQREVTEIRTAYSRGMSQADLAKAYDVNPATISRTVRGIYH